MFCLEYGPGKCHTGLYIDPRFVTEDVNLCISSYRVYNYIKDWNFGLYRGYC